MAKRDKRFKVHPDECKSLAEWLKRCGPYDKEQIALDVLTEVPIGIHEAAYMLLRGYTERRKLEVRSDENCSYWGQVAAGMYGARGWDHLFSNLCKVTVPRAVGDMIFKAIDEGRKRKNDLSSNGSGEWFYANMSTQVEANDGESPLEKLRNGQHWAFRRMVSDLQFSKKWTFRVGGEAERGDEFVIVEGKDEKVRNGVTSIVFPELRVIPPKNILARLCMREPDIFGQYVYNPEETTDTGHNIKTARPVLIIKKKLIGYLGPETYKNAIHMVTGLTGAGGDKGYQTVDGIWIHRDKLAELRPRLGLRKNTGEKVGYEWSREQRLHRNYYLIKNKVIVKTITRFVETEGAMPRGPVYRP
jgi:hypothetical protein